MLIIKLAEAVRCRSLPCLFHPDTQITLTRSCEPCCKDRKRLNSLSARSISWPVLALSSDANAAHLYRSRPCPDTSIRNHHHFLGSTRTHSLIQPAVFAPAVSSSTMVGRPGAGFSPSPACLITNQKARPAIGPGKHDQPGTQQSKKELQS
jgi:hypothetical protein